MVSLTSHLINRRKEVSSEPQAATQAATQTAPPASARTCGGMRKRSLSALVSVVAAVVLSTVALAGTAFATESTAGSDADPLSAIMQTRLSATAITPQATNPAVQSGVYAFACAEDGSSEYTLVLKKGTDEPTGYGVVLSDWHKDTDAHKAIDITDYNNVNKDGGIATPSTWSTSTGESAESWPWRFDENFRSSITKVVALDGVTMPSVYYMFAGLENVREFDLSGMDTTNLATQKSYGTTYADPYSINYMFGQYGSTAASKKPSSVVEKIITGEKWTMPTLFGFFNAGSSNKPGTTFYFTARDNTIVSRTQYLKYDYSTSPRRNFWEWLPQDGFKHIYYTSEDACKANQEADYKTCYGDIDPTQFADTFGFSKQPYDVAGYVQNSAYSYTTKVLAGPLTVTASYSPANGCVGEKAPTYQWYKSTSLSDPGTAISGQTTNTLRINNASIMSQSEPGYAYFYCVATNTEQNGGTGKSNVVKVTVMDTTDGPTITAQPAGTDSKFPLSFSQGEVASALTVNVASTADFKATYGLADEPTVSYQWYQARGDGDFEAIEGATSESYTPSTRVDAGLYRYYCKVTYTVATYAHGESTLIAFTDSDISYVEVLLNGEQAGVPVIESVNMDDATYESANDAVNPLSVAVSVPNGATGDLTYQWYASDDDIANPEGDDKVGTASAVPADGVLTYQPAMSRLGSTYYYCVVTNTVYTDAATGRVATATSKLTHIVTPESVHVTEPAQLRDVVNNPLSYTGYKVLIDADLDLASDSSTATWTAGTSLSGVTIDGQGHAIKGLNIVSSQKMSGSMLGTLTNSTVKNLVIEGSVEGVATIADKATKCSFENIISRCSVTSGSSKVYTGGIVAQALNCTFKNCGNEGVITGAMKSNAWGSQSSYCTGGIVGALVGASTVSGCYNEATVSAQSACGLIGEVVNAQQYQQTFDAYEQGDVVVENCYNTGIINCIQPGVKYPDESATSAASFYWPGTSGLVGAICGDDQNSYGFSDKVKISNCYNAGDLTFWGESAAGVDQKYIDAISFNNGKTTDIAAISNSYYLSSAAWQNSYAAQGKTADELSGLTATLNGESGTAWKDGVTYPVLAWQALDDTDAAPVFANKTAIEVTTTQGTAYAPLDATADYAAGLKAAYRGTITYQWYSYTGDSAADAVAIENATSATYTPSCDTVGTVHYYCVATNTYATGSQLASSPVYTCKTASAAAAATPVITAQPQSTFQYPDSMTLVVEASVSGEGAGDLTYQWYKTKNAEADTSKDTLVKGATEPSYTVSYEDGYNYYCLVTNTFEETKTATATSALTKPTWIKEVSVKTPADLKAVSDAVADGMSYSGVVVKLEADIDLSSDPSTAEWQPIGGDSYFSGEFDGQGHTISGLSITANNPQKNYHGLFGYVSSAKIHDFTVVGAVAGKGDYAAGVAAASRSNTTIKNVAAKVNVSAGAYAGGIVGSVERATLTVDSCANWGDITCAKADSWYAGSGGIIGGSSVAANVTNCFNRGSISGELSHQGAGAGGIVGATYKVKVANCYSSGAIAATGDFANHIGGVMGFCDAGSALNTNCYWLDSSCAQAGYFGTAGTDAGCTAKTDAEMKDAAMVSALNASQAGSPWKAGVTYPVLTGAATELSDMPIITGQPAAETLYKLNAEDVKALSVSVAGASNVSYQWFSNTTASTEGATELAGADKATFTPSVTASGTTYYFCKVTSGATTLTSGIAKVFVTSATEAATPVITVNPASAEYATGAEAEALTVEATVSGEGAGELTYQWYKMAGSEPDAQKDTAIEGATESSYVPATAATASYYCVVTNTFEQIKTAQATSEVATITCVNKVVTISSLAELAAFRDSVNAGNDYFGVTVNLTPGTYDLALSTATSSWKPIASTQGNNGISTPFRGTFEGNGSVLRNVNATGSDSYTGALFGMVEGGTVRDLTIEASLADTAFMRAALVVGQLTDGATLSNVNVTGTISLVNKTNANPKNGYVGGVVAEATDSTIENVTADVVIEGFGQRNGGIVGSIKNSTVAGCQVSGTMAAIAPYVSGKPTGGIVGYASASKVIECGSSLYVAESAKATQTNDLNVSKMGGIVGSAEDASSIVACKNSGKIEGMQRTGGIAGQLIGCSTIDSSYNTGEVTYRAVYSKSLTGGLVGKLESGSKISNSYNVGEVNASSANCGGIVGEGAIGDISNVYYSVNAYPTDKSGITADTDARMAGEAFVSDVSGEAGCFTYNPNGTPALYWETPHYLSEGNVALEADTAAYAGEAVEPAVIVTYLEHAGQTVTLAEGIDYTVTYANNVNPGTATVTVTGTGDYAGTIEKSFTITTAKLTITADDASKHYDEVDPELTYSVEGLAEGDEVRFATVTRAAGDEIGTYKVTVSGGIVVRGNTIVTDGYDINYVDGSFDIVGTDTAWSRLSGDDRYETMAKISQAGFESSDTVIVASGSGFADALSATALAGYYNAPIVLSDPSALSAKAASEIERLGAKDAILVGGTAALSDSVKASIDAMGVTTHRIYGDSRALTALEVYNTGAELGAWGSTAIVTTGSNFADALSISSFSYAQKAPIFLASNGELDQASLEAIKKGGFTRVLLVGGTGVVSDSVKDAIGSGVEVKRLAGNSRYETSATVASFCLNEGMSVDGMAVAYGGNFPDALAGGALCGSTNSIIMLAEDGSDFVSPVLAGNKWDIHQAYVLGGEGVVSKALMETFEAACK